MLDHHGNLGQTKSEYEAQYQQAESLMEGLHRKLSIASEAKPKSLEECQDILAQIEVRFMSVGKLGTLGRQSQFLDESRVNNYHPVVTVHG